MMRIGAVILALVLFGTCHGATTVLFANMTGSQVSGSASTATGTGLFFYDDVDKVLNYFVYHNVQNIVGAHFHGPAPAGVEANIMFALANNNALSGKVSSISDSQIQSLIAGTWYILIHSETYPAGEIRGQMYVNTAITYAALINTNGYAL
jgi:hypothetical protein